MNLMSRFGLGAALTLLSGLALAAPEIGKPAPDFSTMTTLDENLSMGALADKTVVLEWTNADCPYVQKHYGSGNMQSLQEAAAADDVVWISVISSAPGKQGHVDAATANALSEERGAAPAHIVLDPSGEIGRLYDARTTPHMFVIDKGTLAFMGGIDDIRSANPADIPKATNYVTAALTAIKAGDAVETPIAKPYGCSVKY